jgi:hypothetical protein
LVGLFCWSFARRRPGAGSGKENAMTEILQELVDSRGAAMVADRQQGVLRGVKILGLLSRNGRRYLADALARAIPLYEGAKVNVNHPKGNPGGPRDYQDRIGAIRNVSLRRDEGLFGDLHFNPKHALAEQLLWDAEHAPENVGFSHNVEARTVRDGDAVVVEAITKVQSVDLVADPATTRGLFEAAGAAGAAASGEIPAAIRELSLEQLGRQRPDLVEAIRAEAADALRRLREELEGFRAAEALTRRRELVRRALGEHGLPDPDAPGADEAIVSRRFVEHLLAAADDSAVRELVAERAALVRGLSATLGRGGSRPQSREQTRLDAPPAPDAKGFAAAIT